MSQFNSGKGTDGAFVRSSTEAANFSGLFFGFTESRMAPDLRKSSETVSCRFQARRDCYRCVCQCLGYRLAESSYVRGQAFTPKGPPHCHVQQTKPYPSFDADLLKMAANIQILKTKKAKQYQAHLLCQMLAASLRNGKQ